MNLASSHSFDGDDFSITDTSVITRKGKAKKGQQVPESPSKNLVVAAESFIKSLSNTSVSGADHYVKVNQSSNLQTKFSFSRYWKWLAQ